MWEINHKWYCSSPHVTLCTKLPKKIDPDLFTTPFTISIESLGKGLYSTSALSKLRKFLASGSDARQVSHDMAYAISSSSEAPFNMFNPMNPDSIHQFQNVVTDFFFGHFSKVKEFVLSLMAWLLIWGMVIKIMKTIYSIVTIYQRRGCRPKEMLASIVDPIFYVMWTMWNPDQPVERPHSNGFIAVENYDVPTNFAPADKATAPNHDYAFNNVGVDSVKSSRIYPDM
jgi:hypothetical protein